MTKVTNEKRSRIDPTRNTVGSIYRDAQLSNHDPYVEAGDLTRELTNSLVDDLNEAFASNPFESEDFYVIVYEKKDLQMKNSILRRLYKTKFRPYPEDDTIVFYVNPRSQHIKFCWCLPHSTEMDNVLLNFTMYDKDYVNDIRAWKEVDLKHFGFDKVRSKVKEGDRMVEKDVLCPSKNNNDKPLNFPQLQLSIR